jgi:hypothetical protein
MTVVKVQLLEMNGVVVEVLPDARFGVALDNGHKLGDQALAVLMALPAPR